MTMVGDFEVRQLPFAMHSDQPVFCWKKTLVNEGSYCKVQSEPRAPLQQQSHASLPSTPGTNVGFHARHPTLRTCPAKITPPERLRWRRVCLQGGLRLGRQPTPKPTRLMPLARPTEALYFTGNNGGPVS